MKAASLTRLVLAASLGFTASCRDSTEPVTIAQNPVDNVALFDPNFPLMLLFLHGQGPTANPAALSLDADLPAAVPAKFREAAALDFSGGNPWTPIGNWTSAHTLLQGTLGSAGPALLWLSLKSSADAGTRFDVQVEAFKNTTLIASGKTLCVQGLGTSPNVTPVLVSLPSFSGVAFNGNTDSLALTVSTRIGTTASGAACGTRRTATGLRLYFDGLARLSTLPIRFRFERSTFNVTSAASTANTSMTVTFDAPPNPTEATTLANYAVPGLTLSGTPSLSANTVTITTSSQSAVEYTVTASGITRAADGQSLTNASATFAGQPPVFGGTTTQLSFGSPTDQQNQPAISGTQVAWTDASSPPGSPTNFDVVLFDLTTNSQHNITGTPTDQEFLQDIDGGRIPYTHTSPSIAGDIALYQSATGTTTTIATSNVGTHYEQPAIGGHYVTFLKASGQIDVMLYDLDLGTATQITSDAAVQNRPRISGDVVVYEDYASGNADVYGYRISTGTTFPIATGPGNQITPDVSGNTVVYASDAGGSQLYTYDLISGTTTQITTATSAKILPHISGPRIVWSDDRSGSLDVFLYDQSDHTEHAVASGFGDQFLADIDGNRVVYTDNSAGFEQVYLFTIDGP
jgi:beta propeller repeat protein